MSDAVERCKVVIVGAGASGLYCAHLLAEQSKDTSNHDIVVLEVRYRIGGRIHSVTHELKTIEGKAKSVVIDYGAAWVHGTGHDWREDTESLPADEPLPESINPMMELLVQAKGVSNLYKSQLKPVCLRGNPWVRPKYVLHDNNNIALYLAGQRLDVDNDDSALIEKALARHFETFQKVSDYGNQMFEEERGMETVHHCLQDAIDQVKASLPNDDDERVDALARWYQHFMEAWYGGQASDMQLLEFTRDPNEQLAHDEVYCAEGDFYGPHCTLSNGMKTVLEPLLANGGAERVRCEQEVLRIEETKHNTVLVETSKGLKFEADCCVVTLPVGCLKDAISPDKSLFRPALSEEKIEAIKALNMGKYKKVLLSFDRIFWPAQETMIGMVRNVNPNNGHVLGNELLLDNLWARDGIPAIEAVLLGDAATWATGKDADTIRDAVLDFMKDAMGLQHDLSEWCIGPCHVTRWEEDVYSRGAFSCYTLGTRERHTEALRRSEWNGKLVFAGEACISEYEGSVHAALFSARNAANEVRQCLGLEEREGDN